MFVCVLLLLLRLSVQAGIIDEMVSESMEAMDPEELEEEANYIDMF
jgi:hypothetical protein